MSKQTFTTGQVLTAAQVNSLQANDFNQTVSVKTANYTLAAADKGTRIEFNTSGSVTCTVNSGLFDAGDTLVIQNRGAGTATITAGTATVNTSASLALAQYSAGTLYFVSDSAAIFFGDAAGISASIVDAKGDLIVGTADNTVGRLAVGTNGYTLVADSVETTGLKWVAPSGALSIAQIASGSLTSGTQLQLSSLTSYDTLILRVNGLQWATSADNWVMTINNSSAEVYDFNYGYAFAEATYVGRDNGSLGTKIYLSGDLIKRDSGQNAVIIVFTNCKSAGFTTSRWTFGGRNANNFNIFATGDCVFKSAAAVSTLEFKLDNSRTFSAGSYTLWGA